MISGFRSGQQRMGAWRRKRCYPETGHDPVPMFVERMDNSFVRGLSTLFIASHNSGAYK